MVSTRRGAAKHPATPSSTRAPTLSKKRRKAVAPAGSEGENAAPPSTAAAEPAAVTSKPETPDESFEEFSFSLSSRPWDPTDSSHVQAVKKALHLSEAPDTILCRDTEQNSVITFCKACVTEQQAGSIYICGCPGTGKSLTVEKVTALCANWSQEAGTLPPGAVTINCTSLTDPRRIYSKILQALKPPGHHSDDDSSNRNLVMKELKQLTTFSPAASKAGGASKRRMLLLIVDEMDYLITRDQSVLYDLFRLPTLPNSRLVLIGVANAIDLTDRLLPKLRSMNCKVDAITFPTYTKDQILAVLHQRLKSLPFSVFQPLALELCARKVSAATGDMRKALHVCRSAVEVVVAEADGTKSDSAKPDVERSDGNQPKGKTSGSAKIDGDVAKETECGTVGGAPLGAGKRNRKETCGKKDGGRVQIDTMARVLSRVFRSPVVETIQVLPTHQQMVLCATVGSFQRGKKDCNVGELNAAYLGFCKSTGMQPLTPPEFSSVCQVLADQALLGLGKSKEDRLRRVTLKVDEEDVVFALQGVRFFRTCLEGLRMSGRSGFLPR